LDAAASRQDDVPAHDGLGRPIAPFDQNIGLDGGDEVERGIFGKGGDKVRTGQAGQDKGPLVERGDRP
jgi:hypothetical protein